MELGRMGALLVTWTIVIWIKVPALQARLSGFIRLHPQVNEVQQRHCSAWPATDMKVQIEDRG
ncbi:MAG: hypothetical protein B7Y03_11025 [Polaromonas sp. 24-62-144]|nr:MAG: hypothetical protein B7Y03_11025 [Polaromonas sp. 24-62-144]